MSQWTHVAGLVRVDDLIALTGKALDLKARFGVCSGWDDDHDAELVPCGSEGSLTYHIHSNPCKDHLAAHVVAFYGDLRDYSSVDNVLTWLNNACSGLMIRQGVVEIAVEYQTTAIARWDDDKKRFVEVHTISEKSQ